MDIAKEDMVMVLVTVEAKDGTDGDPWSEQPNVQLKCHYNEYTLNPSKQTTHM